MGDSVGLLFLLFVTPKVLLTGKCVPSSAKLVLTMSKIIVWKDTFIKVLTDLGSIDNLLPSPHRDE